MTAFMSQMRIDNTKNEVELKIQKREVEEKHIYPSDFS